MYILCTGLSLNKIIYTEQTLLAWLFHTQSHEKLRACLCSQIEDSCFYIEMKSCDKAMPMFTPQQLRVAATASDDSGGVASQQRFVSQPCITARYTRPDAATRSLQALNPQAVESASHSAGVATHSVAPSLVCLKSRSISNMQICGSEICTCV